MGKLGRSAWSRRGEALGVAVPSVAGAGGARAAGRDRGERAALGGHCRALGPPRLRGRGGGPRSGPPSRERNAGRSRPRSPPNAGARYSPCPGRDRRGSRGRGIRRVRGGHRGSRGRDTRRVHPGGPPAARGRHGSRGRGTRRGRRPEQGPEGAVVAEAGGAVVAAAAALGGDMGAVVAEAGGAVLAGAGARATGIGHGGAVLVHVAADAAAGTLIAAALALLAPRLAALEAALRRIEALRREALGLLRGEHEGGAAVGTGDVLVLMFHGSSRTVGGRWSAGASWDFGQLRGGGGSGE